MSYMIDDSCDCEDDDYSLYDDDEEFDVPDLIRYYCKACGHEQYHGDECDVCHESQMIEME